MLRRNILKLSLGCVAFIFLCSSLAGCAKTKHNTYGAHKKQTAIAFHNSVTGKTEGSEDPRTAKTYTEQYNAVVNSDPAQQLELAVKKDDYRFIGIQGVGHIIPASKKNDTDVQIDVQIYGFKIIAGTSDSIILGLPPLQGKAYDYAKKYNDLLLERIRNEEKLKRNTILFIGFACIAFIIGRRKLQAKIKASSKVSKILSWLKQAKNSL